MIFAENSRVGYFFFFFSTYICKPVKSRVVGCSVSNLKKKGFETLIGHAFAYIHRYTVLINGFISKVFIGIYVLILYVMMYI